MFNYLITLTSLIAPLLELRLNKAQGFTVNKTKFSKYTVKHCVIFFQGYLQELNEMRQKLTKPLPPVDYRDSDTRETVTAVNSDYDSLSRKCDDLTHLLSDVDARSSRFDKSLADAKKWLSDYEKDVNRCIEQPVNPDPKELQAQIVEVRELINAAYAQQPLIDHVKFYGEEYLALLGKTDQLAAERETVNNACNDLENRLVSINCFL